MNYFNSNDYINRFKVTKTLKFSLLPMFETFNNMSADNILEDDRIRNEEFSKVKEFADEYHKMFCSTALSNLTLSDDDIGSLFDYVNGEDNGIVKALITKVYKLFTNNNIYNKLIGKELVTELLPSVFNSKDELELFSHFNRFTTYFNKYNTSRAQMYQPNGIPKRVVDNILTAVKNYNECDVPWYFNEKATLNKIFTQNDINIYNENISNSDSNLSKLRDLFLISNYKDNDFSEIKLSFNNPNFLFGWDINKEKMNCGAILIKNGNYYLAVIKDKSVFDNAYADDKDNYQKMIYKLIPNASKYFSSKQILPQNPPANIVNILTKKKSDPDAVTKDETTEFVKYLTEDFIPHYPNLNDKNGKPYFDFKFEDCDKYNTISEFFSDIDRQSFSMKFIDVSAQYIREAVRDNKIYLFQIYNKDMSKDRKNKESNVSLNTIYIDSLFSELNSKISKLKLNGGAEIFYRYPTEQYPKIHKAGEQIKNKNPINGKEYSKFDYDIVANRRFTKPQFTLHFSIDFNNDCKDDIFHTDFDRKVREDYANDDSSYVLSVIRGKDVPLYMVVMDKNKNIIDECQVSSQDANAYIYNIYNYIIKYNIIIIIEDLNLYIKHDRSIINIKKYKDHENKLINKLIYIIIKNFNSCFNSYQFCHKEDSTFKMQNGIVFRINYPFNADISDRENAIKMAEKFISENK